MGGRLRLGLVGAGPVAERYHVPAIRGVPEVKASMVADVDTQRAQRLADLAPFERVVARAEDLCGNVDLAIVALPNALHAPIACLLLEAGVHVLCEKPMARTVAECRQMLAAAEKGGAMISVGHNRRFRTNVLEAKKLIDRGTLGEIKRVTAVEGSTSDWPRSQAYFDPAVAGGGAMMDVGIHAIDLIRFLVSGYAQVEYSGNGTPATVESEGRLRFKLANGAEGEIHSSRDRNLGQELALTGAEGELRLGLWGPDLILRRPKGKAFQFFESLKLNPVRRAMDASFVEHLLQFALAVRDRKQPPVPGEDGLEAVRVVQWGYAGARPD